MNLQLSSAFSLLLLLVFGGCASETRVAPLAPSTELAGIPGIERARFWGDEPPPWLEESLQIMRTQLETSFSAEEMRLPSNYLVISGGGGYGAYGAGFLAGWTASGLRPPFVVVTGISTGALIAPFAFAGPEYDDVLREMYTSISTDDLVSKRGPLSMFYRDAMWNADGLGKYIAMYVNQELIDAIAKKYAEGRRLYVGTTYLDAERPVIWDVSEIASSNAPGSLELIQKILLASASIPGALPPVYIDVNANGVAYDEMHVDGGATTQLFLYPASLDWKHVAQELHLGGEHRLYILRNGYLDPIWEPVEPRLGSIAHRSIHSLIRTHGRGDLYRLYLGAQRDNIAYHLAYVPPSFTKKPTEWFDEDFMTHLFNLAYEAAADGYSWHNEPPGFHPP